jgi:hypothetical protein
LTSPAAGTKKNDEKTFDGKSASSFAMVTALAGIVIPHSRRIAWAGQAWAMVVAITSGSAPRGLGDPLVLKHEASAFADAAGADSKKVDLRKTLSVLGYLRHFKDVQYFFLAVCSQEHASPPDAGNARTNRRIGGVIDESGTRREWDYAVATMHDLIDYIEIGSEKHSSIEAIETVLQYLERTVDFKMKRGDNFATAVDDSIKMMSFDGVLASQGGVRSRPKAAEAEVSVPKSPRAKEGLCNDFQQGRCQRGTDCPYQHACRGCLKAGHGMSTCWARPGGRGSGRDAHGRYPSRSPERGYDQREDRRGGRDDDRRGDRYDRPRDDRRDTRQDGRRRY